MMNGTFSIGLLIEISRCHSNNGSLFKRFPKYGNNVFPYCFFNESYTARYNLAKEHILICFFYTEANLNY